MLYFVLIGIAISLLFKRNPMGIVQCNFRAPYILIGGLVLQAILAALKLKNFNISPFYLILTFLLVLFGLFLNRNLIGLKWIIAGCALNVLALLLNGGLMPVSEQAAQLAGLGQTLNLDTDSRHQIMKSAHIWWIGDWIPFIKHVLSPGDILVGVGLIRFIFYYSNPRRRNQ